MQHALQEWPADRLIIGGPDEAVAGLESYLSAAIPLKELFGYVTALRSLSQGRGNYTMKFSHYDKG